MNNMHFDRNILLQSGVHCGVILREDFDDLTMESRFLIGFSKSKVRLQYILNLTDPKHRSDYETLSNQGVDESPKEMRGRERLFNIELGVINTSRGSVGVNVIAGVLPEGRDEALDCWLSPTIKFFQKNH